MAQQAQDPQRKKKGRSPSYPAIALEKAIDRAEALRKEERGNYAPVDAILDHWGYRPGSGLGLVTLSALVKFGLLEDSGSKGDRQARLTESAMTILLSPEDSKERLAAIQEAALNPPIHAALWEKYGKDLPSPVNLKMQLLRQNFLHNAADELVQEYQNTLAFAKLLESDSISVGEEDKTSTKKPDLVDSFDSFSELPATPFGQATKDMISRTEEPQVSEPEPRIIQLPLSKGRWAALQASFPMTEDDWRQMLAVLDAMKLGLVTADTANGE